MPRRSLAALLGSPALLHQPPKLIGADGLAAGVRGPGLGRDARGRRRDAAPFLTRPERSGSDAPRRSGRARASRPMATVPWIACNLTVSGISISLSISASDWKRCARCQLRADIRMARDGPQDPGAS